MNSGHCCDGRREEITLNSSVDSSSRYSFQHQENIILATKIVMGAVHQRWAVTFKSVDKVQTFAYVS